MVLKDTLQRHGGERLRQGNGAVLYRASMVPGNIAYGPVHKSDPVRPDYIPMIYDFHPWMLPRYVNPDERATFIRRIASAL